jgi:dolichol-phosphate mannosyltransferase
MLDGVAIAIPTYNEIDAIQKLISSIREFHASARIVVIDDNSPDGTAGAVRRMAEKVPNVELIWRPQKAGLAPAYLEGFEKILRESGIRHIVTMDGDLSHSPRDLPALLDGAADADLVVGSRYVQGGAIENWNLWRRALSKYGNHYARCITGCPIADLTSGFALYRRELLERILRNRISSTGYAYQIEMKYLAVILGARVKEVPITFCDRRDGVSKLEHDAATPYLFDRVAHFPIKAKRVFVPHSPGEWDMGSFRYDEHQEGTDYFLVKTRRKDVIDDLGRHVPLLAQSGDWMAYGPNPKRRLN